MSPLELDKETVNQFEITENHESEMDRKLEYLEAQIDEMRFIVWRARVDIILAQQQIDSGNENLAENGVQKQKESRNHIKQLLPAIDTLVTLRNELQ